MISQLICLCEIFEIIPESKVHGANMGPTWVLSSPGGPHVGPMNLAIGDITRIGNTANSNLLEAGLFWGIIEIC